MTVKNDVVDAVAAIEPEVVSQAELVVAAKGGPATGTVLYSSVEGGGFEQRKRVLKAVTSSSPLRENLRTPIKVVDMVAIQSEVVSSETGELNQVARVVLIDEKGNSFHAMSDVVYKDVLRITGMLGAPSTWPEALPVVAVEGKAKTGQFITLTIQ